MKDKKSIIIYYSRADENYSVGYITKGNTQVLAEYIKDLTNSDIFKVEPLIPYSKDYETAINEAKERQENHNAPIKENIPDISSYEVIYIGSPIYWNTMPEELITALKNINFKGKIIRPFTTHEGSGLGDIPKRLGEICIGSQILNGLAIQGSNVNTSRSKVEEWI